jgi:HlyD family secretion protein
MGAWSADVAVARAKVDLARAQVHAAEVNLALTTVSSPVDGEVLQVNIRVGEYAENGPLATPLMIMGDTRTLHVRANIDEYDAWRVRPEAPARAALRGNPDLKADLTFVRIEPYIIPKKSLTGYAPERVDTRVLQVIYAFPGDALPVHVGQMVDVFIEPAGSARVEPNE